MKIVINNLNSEYQETKSFENLENIDENLKNFFSTNEQLDATIFAINESLSANQLLKLKNKFRKVNNFSLHIFSNKRDTIIAGKSLKIDSTFVKEKEAKNKLNSIKINKSEDILHEGTVRSGDRISANGNLCIIGDVDPGAIVSAKKNIYVWGKLQGVAFAGKGGDNNSSITSLFLNPLQLRIADVIAIGPEDKPKSNYPEIAVIDKETIIINPYIIEMKN